MDHLTRTRRPRYVRRMCCFSRPVVSVSKTHIFAREAPDGRQHLAYEMRLEASEDLAMILPLPVRPGSPDDALQFVDLSGYGGLFEDLARGFPEPQSRGPIETLRAPRAARAPLAVVDVGSFEASFVPSVGDFDRLDERFRLPPDTWAALPGYERFGFAVFKLKPGNRRIHPMAFTFPRASADTLFFPTVHIHDGRVHPKATFDHALYCQWSNRARRNTGVPGPEWASSTGLAKTFCDPKRASPLIDAEAHCFRRRITGRAENRDIYVEA